MEKKLISMTDFVLEHPATTDYEWQLQNHFKYANFLKQPLKKGMFVPCDKYGNVLELPKVCICTESCLLCKKVEEKVLFKGFQFSFCVENITCISNKENDTNILFFNDGRILIDSKKVKTIEDLIPYNLTLKNKMLKF